MPITRKLKCRRLIGIDAWLPNIEKMRKTFRDNPPGYEYQLWNFDLNDTFLSAANDDSIDVSLAIDLIEHFEKEDALKLIDHMERMSRKRIIIYTPSGFVWQERVENVEFQRHRCCFEPEEFEAMGYEVFMRIGGNIRSFLAVKEV